MCGRGGVVTTVITPAFLTAFDRPPHTYEEEWLRQLQRKCLVYNGIKNIYNTKALTRSVYLLRERGGGARERERDRDRDRDKQTDGLTVRETD